jgi:lipoyl(octanoyl) transferase
MTQSVPCRLLQHGPATGAWNMAVDERLLERAQAQSAACLRFYRWSEPTLSLGYFQTCADRQRHAASRHCPAVRRLTGGGAILHDDELTYSIVLPVGHPLAGHRDRLYRAVHCCLIDALASVGLSARVCEFSGADSAAPETFLCFQRRSPGDVLLGKHKICGSAQRRRNGAVLQHGSLLLRASAAAPELPGLADMAPRPISREILLELWLNRLARQLSLDYRRDELDEAEVVQAQTLAESRYCHDNWTIYKGRWRDSSCQAGEVA